MLGRSGSEAKTDALSSIKSTSASTHWAWMTKLKFTFLMVHSMGMNGLWNPVQEWSICPQWWMSRKKERVHNWHTLHIHGSHASTGSQDYPWAISVLVTQSIMYVQKKVCLSHSCVGLVHHEGIPGVMGHIPAAPVMNKLWLVLKSLV